MENQMMFGLADNRAVRKTGSADGAEAGRRGSAVQIKKKMMAFFNKDQKKKNGL